jgi:putative ABC transport system permease protein
MMSELLRDLRLALRSVRKSPGFTLVAVITLGLGIGANTAIFSVVNGVLLRPLPYLQPERLVVIRETYGDGLRGTSSGPDYLDWRARNRGFQQLSAYRQRSVSVTGEGEPEEVAGTLITSDFFRMLGVPLAAGREFAPEEENGEGATAILSDGLWRTRYAADPGVLGRTIRLAGRPHTVIGIAPPGFAYPGGTQVWLPGEIKVGRAAERSSHSFDVVGRLKPGVSLDDVRADLAAIMADLARDYPASNMGRGIELTPLVADTLGAIRPALLLLAGAVALVLLIACANIANLFLARAAGRQREIAVRSALGAGRWRIARQLLAESVVLAGLGGVMGVLLALWGVDALLALRPRGIPRLQEIGIDGAALAFTFGISLLVGIGFGLAPAIGLSRRDPADSLRGEGRGSSESRARVRLRHALVVVQVSLALVLLVGASLLVVTVRRLTAVDAGFQPDGALVLDLPPLPARQADQAQHAAFIQRVLEGIEAVPQVRSVGAVFYLPLDGSDVSGDFNFEGAPPPEPGREQYAGYRMVSGDFFGALGVAIRRGRPLGPEDRAGAPKVAVVNEAFVRRFLGGGEPLGRRITFGDGTEDTDYMEIVGVAADVRTLGLTVDAPPEIYAPFAQLSADLWTVFTSGSLSVAVRSEAPVERLAPLVRRAVRQVDPEQVVSQLRPAGELVSDAVARQRFSMLLLLAFGGLALALAGVGVYGVLAYTVSQRTRELGIRVALGASASTVRALVLRQGIGVALVGLGLGIAGALLLSRLLVAVLYEVSPTDPLVLAAASAILGGVATVACLIPAVRATRLNPVEALRSEG